MFNKELFSELLINARGDRNNKQYADDSGVSRAYISGYINKSMDSPPTPDVIKRLCNVAHNSVMYEQLMNAAGYINSDKPSITDENILFIYDVLRKENMITDDMDKDKIEKILRNVIRIYKDLEK